MGFIKFSFLLILSLNSALAFQVGTQRFSSRDCLESSYVMKMVNQGPFFNLIRNEFVIDKKNCVLKFSHQKYGSKEWIIDVCREPVHIKSISMMGIEVAKKSGVCRFDDSTKELNEFCVQYQELMDTIQDEGLIFASGDRDDLRTNHGRVYCSYLLLSKYLNQSVPFSRYTDVPEIFTEPNKPKIVIPIPLPAPVIKPIEEPTK